MKSKKLLISLAVVAFVIVIIVVMFAVFAVDAVEVRYHAFNGREIVLDDNADGVVPDEILDLIKGKSTIFLSKSDLIDKINNTYREWHAFAVVKNFPSSIEVHFVKRTVIAKVSIGGNPVYIDCFGYVAPAPTDSTPCVDISSAFDTLDASSYAEGAPLTFMVEDNNVRLKCVLEAILATWRCKVEVADIPQVLGDANVFRFEEGNLLITPITGGTIKVIAPDKNLSDRLIDAYSVYYNKYYNLQESGWVITVHKNGSITTPDK